MQGWSRDNFDNVHGFYLCYLSSACPGSHVPLYRVTLGADINYSALLMPPPLMYSMMWNCLWNFEELQLRNCLLLVRIKYRYPNMWLIRKESNFLSSGHSPKLSKQSFEGNLCFWYLSQHPVSHSIGLKERKNKTEEVFMLQGCAKYFSCDIKVVMEHTFRGRRWKQHLCYWGSLKTIEMTKIYKAEKLHISTLALSRINWAP